ncbi:MAG: chorismate-binding protein, partial [Bacteroidia bacterium]|nr:chorismate-binding protein [Bacteroidia bacterium]
MTETKITTSTHALPPGMADLITPVSIYLRLRDKFPNTILLESSDYHGNNNSMSYICFDVISVFRVEDYTIDITYSTGVKERIPINGKNILAETFNSFLKSFTLKVSTESQGLSVNGLFGYTTYDSVRYFEEIKFREENKRLYQIPDIYYSLYKYIIAINHFNNRMYLVENLPESDPSRLEEVKSLLRNRSLGSFRFKPVDMEESNISDNEYMDMVKEGKRHCHLGNVFQIVLSRQFSQHFTGDEFNVYRALRNINPSPYLFYFDYGGYKLFGSSPEAQLVIDKGVARI